MEIKAHTINGTQIAEVLSPDLVIQTAADGVDLLGNLYYQNYDSVILHQANIVPAFFDLKTGMAGEILQKFSTYRVRLAVVGEFTQYASNSLQDFIGESNKARHINFVGSTAEALAVLSQN